MIHAGAAGLGPGRRRSRDAVGEQTLRITKFFFDFRVRCHVSDVTTRVVALAVFECLLCQISI